MSSAPDPATGTGATMSGAPDPATVATPTTTPAPTARPEPATTAATGTATDRGADRVEELLARMTLAAALRAGVDVELPTRECYGTDLVAEVETGRLDAHLIDRALRRVLAQKLSLGLLENDYNPLPEGVDDLDLDDGTGRELALLLARESIVLLRDDAAVLPLDPGTRVAVVGPLADAPLAGLGCYTFPVRAGAIAPGCEPGLDLPTVWEALATAHGRDLVTVAAGRVAVDGDDRSGFPAALAAARAAEVCVCVVGDRSGHFGRGTSGEGWGEPTVTTGPATAGRAGTDGSGAAPTIDGERGTT